MWALPQHHWKRNLDSFCVQSWAHLTWEVPKAKRRRALGAIHAHYNGCQTIFWGFHLQWRRVSSHNRWRMLCEGGLECVGRNDRNQAKPWETGFALGKLRSGGHNILGQTNQGPLSFHFLPVSRICFWVTPIHWNLEFNLNVVARGSLLQCDSWKDRSTAFEKVMAYVRVICPAGVSCHLGIQSGMRRFHPWELDTQCKRGFHFFEGRWEPDRPNWCAGRHAIRQSTSHRHQLWIHDWTRNCTTRSAFSTVTPHSITLSRSLSQSSWVWAVSYTSMQPSNLKWCIWHGCCSPW